MKGPCKGAGVLIIDESERVLLGRRKHNPYKHHYSIPGGGSLPDPLHPFMRQACVSLIRKHSKLKLSESAAKMKI
jgi:8-oxo-dGTP pyrophosphatase MutT (NUDIX family)